jgi:hypothetical protein
MSNIHIFFYLLISLTVACTGSIEGTYGDQSSFVEIKFKANGKAEFKLGLLTMEADYKLEDKKIKMGPISGQVVVMDFDKDGCLESAWGKLCKKKE